MISGKSELEGKNMRPRNILKLRITFFFVDFDGGKHFIIIVLAIQMITLTHSQVSATKIILNYLSGFMPLSKENLKTTQSLLKICVRPNLKSSLAFEALIFDLLSNSSY